MITINGKEEAIRLKVSSKILLNLLETYEKTAQESSWDGFIIWVVCEYPSEMNSFGVWEVLSI